MLQIGIEKEHQERYQWDEPTDAVGPTTVVGGHPPIVQQYGTASRGYAESFVEKCAFPPNFAGQTPHGDDEKGVVKKKTLGPDKRLQTVKKREAPLVGAHPRELGRSEPGRPGIVKIRAIDLY